MKPFQHVGASIFAGTIFGILGKNWFAGLICTASGILADIDHILEFIIHFGVKNFSLKNVYNTFKNGKRVNEKGKFSRLYLFFHSIELIFLLIFLTSITKNSYLLAVTLGHSLHVLMDITSNGMNKYFYFLTWRICKKPGVYWRAVKGGLKKNSTG